MIIAVACDGTQVTGHFGHCESFTLYSAEDGKIMKSETILNPGHKPGILPSFLAEKGTAVIIAGSIGERAMALFRHKNIAVIAGASGDAKAAVEAWLAGMLVSNDAACHEHQHQDQCEGHRGQS